VTNDHQFAAIDMLNDFSDHDLTRLSLLTADERAKQRTIRWALFEHVDAIWDAAKARGLSPADLSEFASVAAMRDIASELVANVEQVQENAGDQPEDY
jgi:hypothetical protein